jgi:hypothetical protein
MTLDDLLRLLWRAVVAHAVGIVIGVILFVALVLIVWRVKRTSLGETLDVVIDGRWFERGFYGAIALVLLAFSVLAVINNWPRGVH